MADRILTTTESVPIGSLKPHPDNARRGDVAFIRQSLIKHGQYRPIVANRRTRHILAGNHTWQAAQSLGWEKIAVAWVDVDAKAEKKILLVDNRAADLADYDNAALANLIRSCGDIETSGYTMDELEELEGLYNSPLSLAGQKDFNEETSFDADIVVGPLRMTVKRSSFEAWAMPVREHPLKPEENIRRMLELPSPQKPKKHNPESTPVKLSTVKSESVLIESVQPFDRNARQGDVGILADSLMENGQYRPIVVNRRTNSIVVGNHTWLAAKMLGWEKIAVTFIDVDEKEEARIVLVDNRSSDVAGYDTDTLLKLLKSMATDLNGTGYDGDDIDDLLNGSTTRPKALTGQKIKVLIDEWRIPVEQEQFTIWFQQLGTEPATEIAQRLLLPAGSWSVMATP